MPVSRKCRGVGVVQISQGCATHLVNLTSLLLKAVYSCQTLLDLLTLKPDIERLCTLNNIYANYAANS